MKSALIWFAGASLAVGQTTVVDCFEDGDAILDIGIIPTEDFEEAEAEVARLKADLKASRLKQKETITRQRARFKAQYNEVAAHIEAMEQERAQVIGGLRKSINQMQAEFGREKGQWERRLMVTQEERDVAIRKLEESELIRVRDYEAWQKSVKEWEAKVQQAMRMAQMKAAQEAVANTARLAEEWEAERATISALLAAEKQARITDNAAWEESVREWEVKVQQAMRTGHMEAAQESVANTARLSIEWQRERNALEAQVEEMTAKLAELEDSLGMQSPEGEQTEALRVGLQLKSQALSELGTDAARLANEWRKEREDSRRELAAMRDLYQSSVGDVNASEARLQNFEAKLAEKNQTLNALATEAEKLSLTWSDQRGGLQRKIANLEKKLKSCQGELAAARAKGAQLKEEKLDLLSQTEELSKDETEVSDQLSQQIALAAKLTEQLALAKQQESELKSGLGKIKNQHLSMEEELTQYRQQKEKDAKIIADLRAELKKSQEQQAVTEQNLAEAGESLKGAQEQVAGLQEKTKKLEGELKKARHELQDARQRAQEGETARALAAEKETQVRNLEDRLGRLFVAQEELEGTLISTLGDFEQLQKAYVQLQAKSANGGAATQEAIVAREAAEAELAKVRKRLKGEEQKLQDAEKRVQEVEAKKEQIEAAAKKEAEAQAAQVKAQAQTILATEADQKAGKAALGKCEAELQKARRELGELQLGMERLSQEAQTLRERFVSIEPVRYELASANVVAQQQRVLAEVKQVLEVYPNARFAISGHTCNLGSEAGNLKLSEERALLLKAYLFENGIGEDRITEAQGFGDQEPQASNETDEGRRQNRRVEIKVVK